MSDDWMKDFNLDEPENLTDSAASSNKEIALDSLGIPILEEVVFLEDDYSFDDEITFDTVPEPLVEDITNTEEYFPEAPSITYPTQLETSEATPDIEITNQEATDSSLNAVSETDPVEITLTEAIPVSQMEKLRIDLKNELQQTMEKLSYKLAKEISKTITEDLEEKISLEIKQSLHDHIDIMVDQAIEDLDNDLQD